MEKKDIITCLKKKKQKLKEYQKYYRKKEKKPRMNNLFHSKQPKYCDVISSILSSETFNFFNMISFIFNSSSTSLIQSFNFTIISSLPILHSSIIIDSFILYISFFDSPFISFNFIL